MIISLYGFDTYRSRQKIKELFGEYREKYGDALDVRRIDADEEDALFLKSLLEAQSLFSTKKLIIVSYAFSGRRAGDTKLDNDLLRRVQESKDIMLMLWDGLVGGEAKKRFAQWAPFLSKSQEFKLLTGAQLHKWIQEEAGHRGVRLASGEMAYLLSLKGDGWGIINELEKMAVTPERGGHGEEPEERTVFELGDAFFQNPRSALHILYRLIESGQDEFGLFAYCANHLRTLLVVKGYQERGLHVAANHHIHPFVARKAVSEVRNIPLSRLQEFLRRFLEEDVAIKTGGSTPRESLVRILIH